jgi:hypothetical protein
MICSKTAAYDLMLLPAAPFFKHFPIRLAILVAAAPSIGAADNLMEGLSHRFLGPQGRQ